MFIDVYKRQTLQDIDWPQIFTDGPPLGPTTATQSEPVSYTHLDVYKRQEQAFSGEAI